MYGIIYHKFQPNVGKNIPTLTYLGLSWVVPPPRMTVTTRITIFLVGNTNLNRSLPLLLGGGTTRGLSLRVRTYKALDTQ